MIINRAYKYELKPNLQTRILLSKHAGVARFAYNWGLAKRVELYEKEKKSTNAIAQHRVLNSLKNSEFPWMYEVSKCSPQEALRDLDRAFANFFRGLKRWQKIGFPAFKKKGDKDSFRLTGTIKVENKQIQLPRLGLINLKEASTVKGRILTATIRREVNRWFVSFYVEEEIQDPKPICGDPIGIDLGISYFSIYSDGNKIASPKPLDKDLERLKLYSRQHSRKIKGSKNRKKSALKLSRAHRKIRNIRKDFLHKETTRLAKTKPVILLENLGIKEMLKNNRLSRQISDAGWSEFRRLLEYKTKWYGSNIIIAPQFYPSSKMCSECKVCVEVLPLQIREWECKRCHTLHDRDINSAKNLLNWYTGSSPEIEACGDISDETGQNPVSHVSMKQEVMNGINVHKL